jgi:hypothetical protein
LSSEEKIVVFYAFGLQSKFSFDVGCGLLDAFMKTDVRLGEQSVHNAHNHFERCGGAFQWGIKLLSAFPIASP